ncbi:MAG: PepSY domain-containing protein [Rhodobacteraceae bacterium]|nr:PepSY domain-containing protein [Paracoccaceae bacterium]
MRLSLIRTSAIAVLLSTSAMAQGSAFATQVVQNLQGLGYTYIEVDTGPTQMKVEAVRGTDKLEVVYDLASGAILREERERATGEYLGRTGVEFDRDDRDFVGNGRDDDDDDRGRGRDRDDDDDDRGRDDDRDGRWGDDDDDDRSSGSGGRDDDDDNSSAGSDDNDDDSDDDDN